MYADYQTTENNLKKLWNARLSVIGKSVFGRNIYAVGFGSERVLIHAAMHAREHVSAMVLQKLLQYRLCTLRRAPKNIAFVPLVNPDGVELCLYGAESAPKEYRQTLEKINSGKDFGLWKANGRAVDLNLNFDADWGKGFGNVRYPSGQGYIGASPFSEPESKALAAFALKRAFEVTVSLHAKGGELYADYKNKEPNPALTEKISQALGYPQKSTPNSCGGFKDWYIEKTNRPSYTVELGNDKRSYTELYLDMDELQYKLNALIEVLGKIGE